jgi:hypothetical protein
LGVSLSIEWRSTHALTGLPPSLKPGNFKWQEFVMGTAILLFLISLKFIQRK